MARPPSDIRARIVEAARERFLLQGVDGASLRSIAEDARTNIGMVYYYFKSKDDLFLAVVEDAYGDLLADMAAALQPDVPAEQRVLRLYERMAAIDEREFQVLRVVLREALISSARLLRLAQRFEQGHIPLVLGTLADGVQSGRFDARRDPAVLAIATAALAVLPQIVHRLVTAAELPVAELLPGREAVARALWEVLLFGIAGPQLGGQPAKVDPAP